MRREKDKNPVMQSLCGSTSLQTGNREGREVQFVLERNCPALEARGVNIPQRIVDAMPFPIWVYWPGFAAADGDLSPACGCLGFQIPGHELSRLSQEFRVDFCGSDAVCEHMGRIIE